jgi:hypothetical protein
MFFSQSLKNEPLRNGEKNRSILSNVGHQELYYVVWSLVLSFCLGKETKDSGNKSMFILLNRDFYRINTSVKINLN